MIELNCTNDGGDYAISENGIKLDNSLKTIVFEALFGGSVDGITAFERKPAGVLYNDYWGNCDIVNDSQNQFNSNFEKKINELPINSGNLILFEGAAAEDLNFLIEKGYVSGLESKAYINKPNVIIIDITIKQPSIDEKTTLSILWDETLKRAEIL